MQANVLAQHLAQNAMGLSFVRDTLTQPANEWPSVRTWLVLPSTHAGQCQLGASLPQPHRMQPPSTHLAGHHNKKAGFQRQVDWGGGGGAFLLTR